MGVRTESAVTLLITGFPPLQIMSLVVLVPCLCFFFAELAYKKSRPLPNGAVHGTMVRTCTCVRDHISYMYVHVRTYICMKSVHVNMQVILVTISTKC